MSSAYLISVSWNADCYRHIKISANATLFKLHHAILNAFERPDGDSHAFFMVNPADGAEEQFVASATDECPRCTKSYQLKRLNLAKDTEFSYVLYDGEAYRFQCRILQELNETIKKPVTVKEVGDLPYDEGRSDHLPELYSEERLASMRAALPFSAETVDILTRCFAAAANLYGAITLRELLDIYNKQNPPIQEAHFLAMAEILRHEKHVYAILGDEDIYDDVTAATAPIDRQLIAEEFYVVDWDEYDELLEQQEGKPYAILPMAEFLRYADETYFPSTPESRALLAYLQEHAAPLRISANELLSDIHFQIITDVSLSQTIEWLRQSGLAFKGTDDFNTFMQLHQAWHNNTRLSVNRGHTPEELCEPLSAGKYLN